MRINKLLSTIACVALLSTTFVGCGATKTPENNTQTEATQTTEQTSEVTELTTDVVIVGAGLSAAMFEAVNAALASAK